VPDWLALWFAGWALAAGIMLAVWAWHVRVANVGVVDVGWTLSVVGLAVLYAAAGPGWPARQWVLAAMTTIWGARLAAYLLRDRVMGRPEDSRYAALREAGSIAARGRFLPFFQAQALIAAVLTAPMLIVSLDRAEAFSPLTAAAVGLWAIAVALESVADRQLERFKARGPGRGAVCREGLWRYSRHPNYFFEWLVWVSYALYGLSSPFGAAGLIAPALMLYFLFRVTGIPATEAQALRTKGDAYRAYQRTTSAFVPWFPRRAA